jgi:hypothetical protein
VDHIAHLNKSVIPWQGTPWSAEAKLATKTIKIRFNSGSFQIIRNVIEFMAGIKYLFIAYVPDGGFPTSMMYEREDIEEVKRLGINGDFKNVKLRRPEKLGMPKEYIISSSFPDNIGHS